MKFLTKKHGFTLVELIVVLVILAILLAILVPALTGWIDKAREKQVIINARTAYLAAQTVESEQYGATIGYAGAEHTEKGNDGNANPVLKLADLDVDNIEIKYTSDDDAKVTAFEFKDAKRTATYDTTNQAWVVTKNS